MICLHQPFHSAPAAEEPANWGSGEVGASVRLLLPSGGNERVVPPPALCREENYHAVEANAGLHSGCSMGFPLPFASVTARPEVIENAADGLDFNLSEGSW
jgi:hypothetical protein